MEPTNPSPQEERQTLLGQLIAELAKFGGFDKEQASRLARILLPHIEQYSAQREQRLVVEAEDRVIAIAEKKCARCDAFKVTPVRSVSGGVTFYCQLCDNSKINVAQLGSNPKGGEG